MSSSNAAFCMVRCPQRSEWFRDYVRTTIERDVVELSGIRKVAEMGQLLRLLAARSSCSKTAPA